MVVGQEIIGKTKVGATVLFVPEPDNEHDADAVRVFVYQGGTDAQQIGYLPRDHNMSVDIASNRVAAWFANRRRSSNGKWGAVLYVAVKDY